MFCEFHPCAVSIRTRAESRWGPPPYGVIGGIVETLASFEARYAPLSYPTTGAVSNDRGYRDTWW